MATPLSSDTGNTDEGSLSTAAEKAFGLLGTDPEFQDTENEEDQPEDNEPEDEDVESEEEDSEDDLSDEEDEGDADDEDLESESEPTKKKVKAEDEEVEVTEDEAERGYLRQQDYTRKTTELAEQRKQFNQMQETLRTEREQYVQKLDLVETALQQGMAEEPDWDDLKRRDPVQYAETRAAFQERKDQIEAVQAEKKREADKAQGEVERLKQQHLAEERERLVEAIPEWLDEGVAKEENQRLVNYALASGFTQQDLDALSDHRAVVLLRKAMLFDEGKQGSSDVLRKTRKKTKTLEPGAAKPRQSRKTKQQKKLASAQKRLAKSGKTRDAHAAFFEFLDDE